MVRRLISAAALVACAGVYAFAATERATFILTNGERESGTIAGHGRQGENLINGRLNLATADRDITFPIEQVAVIDFAGGRAPMTEVAQVGAGQMLVMRDGSTHQGRFVNMIGGDTLIWDNAAGRQQQFAIRDVSRVYLNPQTTRTMLNNRGSRGNRDNPGDRGNRDNPGDRGDRGDRDNRGVGVATTGLMAGRAVRVDAKQPWTDTGITVNAGDRVVFNASGQIQFGQSAGQTSDPNGNSAERRATYPDPTVPVGALLGKIGNSAPFAIGMQTQPLVMPASGRLMLGVNDNELNDNSGFYSVTVTRQ